MRSPGYKFLMDSMNQKIDTNFGGGAAAAPLSQAYDTAEQQQLLQNMGSSSPTQAGQRLQSVSVSATLPPRMTPTTPGGGGQQQHQQLLPHAGDLGLINNRTGGAIDDGDDTSPILRGFMEGDATPIDQDEISGIFDG